MIKQFENYEIHVGTSGLITIFDNDSFDSHGMPHDELSFLSQDDLIKFCKAVLDSVDEGKTPATLHK